MTKEALKLALEALGWTDEWRPQGLKEEAITTIKAALEAKDEPVAWVDEKAIAWLAQHPNGNVTTKLEFQKSFERQMPLYTAQPQRTWVALTDEEKQEIYKQADEENWHDQPLLETVEAKLKDKNNA